MNDDRQLGLPCQRHLIAKNSLLHIARRMIVEIVETNLAPGDDFWMFRQSRPVPRNVAGVTCFRFVRMNANSGVDPIVLLGKRNARNRVSRDRARADREQCGDARGAGAIEHGLAILRELREIDVRV